MSHHHPRYTLTYFPFYGRGGPIRLVFKLAGIPFEDKKISFQEFGQLKSSGVFPFDSLPVLEIDGTRQLAQSNAILLYAGKLAGLAGADELETAYCLSVLSAIEEMFTSLNSAAKTLESRSTVMTGPFTYFTKRLVRMLNENPDKSGFFVGKSLTIADLKFHAFILLCESGFLDYINGSFYADIPEVFAHKHKVEAYIAEKGFTFE